MLHALLHPLLHALLHTVEVPHATVHCVLFSSISDDYSHFISAYCQYNWSTHLYCQAIDIRRSYIYGQAVDNGIITFIARAASSSSSHGPCGVFPENLETVAPALFVQVLEDVRAFGRP